MPMLSEMHIAEKLITLEGFINEPLFLRQKNEQINKLEEQQQQQKSMLIENKR